MRVGRGLLGAARPVAFRWDGRTVHGLEGDTLASALLAHGVRLMGRSFKLHRPRGVLSAGPEEPNALATVEGVPNTRATVQEIWEGMEAKSQNAWPSLRLDALAANDLFGRFLGAGFYYKTFMWPRAAWERLYEPAIRRAAGLGRLPGVADRQPFEKAWAFCDLLVIGAGPAGLMAALVAARAGAEVILADEDSAMGGRLLREAESVGGEPGHAWVARALVELRALPNLRLMPRTTVTGAYDGGTYAALERVGLHLAAPAELPRECFWRIVARAAVLAAGAIERPLTFPANDRPGIMLAGAVRSYLHRWGVAAGRRVAVYGQGPDVARTARDLAAAGVEVAAVIGAAAEGPWRSFPGGQVVATRGRLGLRSLTIAQDGRTEEVEADALAMAGGWTPSVHLACHLGARPVWDEGLRAFLPAEGAVPGMIAAGACAGRLSTADCLADGARAAAAALAELGMAVPEVAIPEVAIPEVEAQAPLPRPSEAPPLPGRAKGKARARARGKEPQFLDFQNDVTVKDLGIAVAEGFDRPEHLKRYTTLGMATDQGKTANVAAMERLAAMLGQGVAETGTTTYRPPYTPVSIAAMGADGEGRGFAPERRTSSHAAAVARGAVMIEAGLWLRASHFSLPGEPTWRESCEREARTVRQTVGVCDVSTLGKIDVQGPDAGAFLDFVYANTVSTLPVGKIRYGIMLREDGFVMDDGTCARLGEGHFLVTTTTAAAGQVMRHMEFALQVLRPELDVQLVSATEQWAQFSIAGPLARGLLSTLTAAEPSDATLPYMGCAEAEILGVRGRIFRISFSGERAYEVAVPARFGAALWRLLVAQAETLGGSAYGLEALNVLRIEKGFPTHAEMHGRTTAFDLGLERMVAKDKDCVGWASSRRPGLLDEEREQLVGLRPLLPMAGVTAGAHLYARGAPPRRENGQGYVTSACWSPALRTNLGLGFLARGRSRHGEVIRLVDRLRGVESEVEVCDPVFLDPQGGRMRG